MICPSPCLSVYTMYLKATMYHCIGCSISCAYSPLESKDISYLNPSSSCFLLFPPFFLLSSSLDLSSSFPRSLLLLPFHYSPPSLPLSSPSIPPTSYFLHCSSPSLPLSFFLPSAVLLLPPRLASIEKFSRFSRLLEMNVNTLHQSFLQLSMAHSDNMSCVNFLGRDFERFSKGLQPTTGGKQGSPASQCSHQDSAMWVCRLVCRVQKYFTLYHGNCFTAIYMCITVIVTLN